MGASFFNMIAEYPLLMNLVCCCNFLLSFEC